MPQTQTIDFKVLFVLGGPGSGKGTQCQALEAYGQSNPDSNFGYIHLSIGDILRAEIKRPGSKYAAIIQDNMLHGRVGPKEITIDLLKDAMQRELFRSKEPQSVPGRNSVFLIDGFPRKMDQALLFEQEICLPAAVIVLEAAEEELQARLKRRALVEGRWDDNDESIAKRISTFREVTGDVIRHYDNPALLHIIDASRAKDAVFDKLLAVLDDILGGSLDPRPDDISTIGRH